MTLNQNIVEVEGGRAAYEALKPRLDEITELRRITADVQKVSITAAAIGRKSNAPDMRARFARLPASDFDIGHVDRLEQAALAAIYTALQYRRAAPGATRAKLPAALFDTATELKQRMLKVLDYHLGDRPEINSKLDDIRQGTGYLDLAEDLWRLAALYGEFAPELAADRRLYRAEDRDTASQLVQRIHVELGEDRSDEAARWADAMQRAWTFLLDTYDEVSAAGRWLFRHEGGDAMFPSLFSLNRSKRRPNGDDIGDIEADTGISEVATPAEPTPA
jgi:hypothetical protein